MYELYKKKIPGSDMCLAHNKLIPVSPQVKENRKASTYET